MIEATAEKHKTFSEQLEQRDAEIFINIPALLVLKSLENDDKEICSVFYPDMYDEKNPVSHSVRGLKKFYATLSKPGSYELYNLVEKVVVEVPLTPEEQHQVTQLDLETKLIKEIRCHAMQLSRFKPADWNKFLDVVIK